MFCKKAQPSMWQCFFKSAVAVFAVIGFFGTLACLKKKSRKMKRTVKRLGNECIDACETLCDDMCDCVTDEFGEHSKNGKKKSDKAE